LAEEEVRITDTKADLTARLTNVTIAERLKSRKKEGRRSGKMRYCESNVGDGHYAMRMAVKYDWSECIKNMQAEEKEEELGEDKQRAEHEEALDSKRYTMDDGKQELR
jgi:hypothetical protein